jgi:putative restriction endonuclease
MFQPQDNNAVLNFSGIDILSLVFTFLVGMISLESYFQTMAEKKLWTRAELVLSLNLYLKLPFGKLHSGTPEVVHLAGLIGRTPSSVAMRLNNFAAVDPYHQQRGIIGLTGGKKQVEPIWSEFIHNKEELLFESERILAEMENRNLEEKFSEVLQDMQQLKGEDKFRQVKTRVNQHVFRQIVIANYAGKCAISGIDISELLMASHILPWAKDEKERLNPENGICLSSLYDKAYDKGYISINERYEVLFSTALKKKEKEAYYERWFAHLSNEKIALPQKYLPARNFLQYHMDVVFKG